jgi:hypothetical protein
MPVTPRTPRPRVPPVRALVAGAAIWLALQPAAAAWQDDPHVRVFDRQLKVLLAEGAEQSPTLRTLLAQIDTAAILVFIDCGRMPTRIAARLHLMTSVNGLRYVRVDVDCALSRQIALLAHELQHALEIAGRVDIVDADAMESYYEDIGFQTYSDGRHKGFESPAAIAVQQCVEDEISGRARPSC